MECNRSEAMRAMAMAEQKFASQDYAGARKLALKAHQLFPTLENIDQMKAVIDVHVAAQSRIGINEKDWYGILQIEPTADDTEVKKQYRKLALFLHPDKNKSIGAESAFKLIAEALQVLSDKVKRLVYDAKRGMHAKVNHTFSGAPNNCWQSQLFQQQQQHYCDVSGTAYNKTSQRHFPQPPHMSPEFHLFTFWTACTSCQMRYQYYRRYENQNLLCPQCRRPFIAKDLSGRHTSFNQTWTPQAGESVLNGPQVPQSNFNLSTGYKSSSYTFANFNSPSCKYYNGFGVGGNSDTFQMFSGATSYMNGEGNASGVKSEARRMQCSNDAEKELLRKIKELHRSAGKQLANQKKQVKKAPENLHSCHTSTSFFAKDAQYQFDTAKKVKSINHDVHTSSSGSEEYDEFWERDPLKGPSNVKPKARQLKRHYSYTANGSATNHEDVFVSKKAKFDAETCAAKQDLEAIDMAKQLADLAKNAIRMKLNLQKTKPIAPDSAVDQVSGKRISVLKARQGIVCDNTKGILSKKDESIASCSVPDSDFHNFDKGREEKDVEVGQIWALYDDKDGMPKYYMKVKEVRSRSPFKVLIGWFELRKPSDELCRLLDLGFSIACGEFRMSSSQIMDSVNSFSHLVSWEKTGKGLVKIYPKKDEIWCLYRDWEAGQHVFRVDGVVGYSMVEVLSDCCEASGVSVMQLNKVAGFKTIFKSSIERRIEVPFLEVLRFSHRVPARRLEGNEASGLSRDCWELDPAAMPSF